MPTIFVSASPYHVFHHIGIPGFGTTRMWSWTFPSMWKEQLQGLPGWYLDGHGLSTLPLFWHVIEYSIGKKTRVQICCQLGMVCLIPSLWHISTYRFEFWCKPMQLGTRMFSLRTSGNLQKNRTQHNKNLKNSSCMKNKTSLNIHFLLHQSIIKHHYIIKHH